jgi:hypothetical protein
MKTSSSEVLERSQCSPERDRRDRRLERGAVAPGNVQARAERRHYVDAGTLFELAGKRRSSPFTMKVVRRAFAMLTVPRVSTCPKAM